MDENADATRTNAVEELILRTVAEHADSLLRTARRHSICLDDAQDAYQHAIEIFMREAHRLDAGHAPGWLHVVVKREAHALRKARQKFLLTSAIDLDSHEATDIPTPEERMLRFDLVSRSAEALKRLKPQELRALWLRAQGHSYGEIGAMTGWSHTKINRCLSEGRRNFLERYERIESGEECERWLPVISAMVDGEASAEQIVDLRPHLRNCPGCRATLRALRTSSTPLAAVFPVPLLVAAGFDASDEVSGVLLRLYEAISGGLHERAVHTVTKAQAILEMAAAGKVTAVAASAAAVAGGGYATVEQVIQRPAVVRRAATGQIHHKAVVARKQASVARAMVAGQVMVASASKPNAVPARGVSAKVAATRTAPPASAFRAADVDTAASTAAVYASGAQTEDAAYATDASNESAHGTTRAPARQAASATRTTASRAAADPRVPTRSTAPAFATKGRETGFSP